MVDTVTCKCFLQVLIHDFVLVYVAHLGAFGDAISIWLVVPYIVLEA